MFFRRETSGDDRWLGAKVALFSVGAAAAVVGMILDSDWVVWLAIGILTAGVLLRLLSDRRR